MGIKAGGNMLIVGGTGPMGLLAIDYALHADTKPKRLVVTDDLNFYDIHYNFTHVVGTSGGNAENEAKAAKLTAEHKLDVAKVITHVLGLNAAAETTLSQHEIGGGKKLIYIHKKFDRIELAKVDPDSELGKILKKHNGIWSHEAEQWILNNMLDI